MQPTPVGFGVGGNGGVGVAVGRGVGAGDGLGVGAELGAGVGARKIRLEVLDQDFDDWIGPLSLEDVPEAAVVRLRDDADELAVSRAATSQPQQPALRPCSGTAAVA